MSDCCSDAACSAQNVRSERRPCPGCGQAGRAVDPVTLRALLSPQALGRYTPGKHDFCASPACPVVYFSGADLLKREDVNVPVFQKEPPGERVVCYCFAVTETDIREELCEKGRASAADRIAGLVKAKRCACELRNPQGRCCLGNVNTVIRELSESAVKA